MSPITLQVGGHHAHHGAHPYREAYLAQVATLLGMLSCLPPKNRSPVPPSSLIAVAQPIFTPLGPARLCLRLLPIPLRL